MSKVVIISGPSGSGKSTLLKELLNNFDNLYFSISTTTREPRKGEVDGVDYFFTTNDDFEEGIENGHFLEWARVHGNYYGTSLKQIDDALSENKIVIFDIDVQGQKIVKEKLKDLAISIFVSSPSINELERRITSRGLDKAVDIVKRLQNASLEMQEISNYDYLIINDNFEEAYKNIDSIIRSINLNLSNGLKLEEFLRSWENDK